jgi:CRISPR-associated protein Csd2
MPETSTDPIQHRYDFVLLFDVVNGNPNGDPDAGNAPRFDPETGHGLVSDVAIKRKIRDFVTLAKRGLSDSKPEDGYDIYIQYHGILEQLHRAAYEALGLDPEKKGKGDTVDQARDWMCQTYWDVRTFGAVMSTGVNCGQVRGPVQITFARSEDPISALEQSITRKAVATQREADSQIEKHGMVTGTMGDKQLVPYALYRAHGFVSPHLAHGTGFTGADLALLWTALGQMFEHDRSAARGEMTTRGLYVFEHESALGNARAHRLFERVAVARQDPEGLPRQFSDYTVAINTADLPSGVTFHDLTEPG